MSKIPYHNGKPSATALKRPLKDKTWSPKDKLRRCRRLPLDQAKLRQILENKCDGGFNSGIIWEVICSICSARDQPFPYEFPQYPPGSIYPSPGRYVFNDRGDPGPSSSIARCSQHGVVFCLHISFRDKFFLTGRFLVGFFQNKS